MSVLATKIDHLEKTQAWMKPTLAALGIGTTILFSFLVYFAQQGIKSFLMNLGASIGGPG